jgi:hypothetical protein
MGKLEEGRVLRRWLAVMEGCEGRCSAQCSLQNLSLDLKQEGLTRGVQRVADWYGEGTGCCYRLRMFRFLGCSGRCGLLD